MRGSLMLGGVITGLVGGFLVGKKFYQKKETDPNADNSNLFIYYSLIAFLLAATLAGSFYIIKKTQK